MYGEKDNLSLEESMAEGFREYVMTRQKKGLLNKIKNFFEDLWIKISNWNKLQPHLISYYQSINEGKYANKIDSISSIKDLRSENNIKYRISSNTQVKPGVTELFESNPELANAVYSKILTNPGISAENLLFLLERENIVEKDCTGGGKLKAEKGLATSFTKGSQWEIVKDLKGYPSHAQGGVDIKLGKDGFSFARNGGEIKAAYGLVLPKIKQL